MGTTVTARTSFEMFSPEGDAAVGELIAALTELAQSASPKLVIEAAKEGMGRIQAKHPEVHDTEPRGHIADAISAAFAEQGAVLEGVTWQL
jgi:hypothetical protein